MGEIKYLKAKCNKLIDKALQLEEKNVKKDLEISKLQEEKKAIELRIKQKREKEDVENIEQKIIFSQEESEEREDSKAIKNQDNDTHNFQISYSKMFEMIQTLSNQIDNRPVEEIVVRNVSTGAKVLEVLYDIFNIFIKLIGIGIAIFLLSLAATILLNGELRNTLFEFIKNSIR